MIPLFKKRVAYPVIFVLLFIMSSLDLNAQIFLDIIEKSKTKNYNEIVRLVEAYYADKDKGPGSGYKQWRRWRDFYSLRLDANGNIVNISELELEAIGELKAKREGARIISPNPGNWQPLGPMTHELMTYNGRINAVAVDPANGAIIYAGAPSGGLWRTTDNGQTWSCLTEGIGSTIGISGIEIDPRSSPTNRTIYLQTGDEESGDVASIGVLKSTDNGNTWTNMGKPGGTMDKIKLHPTDSKILFLAASNGIFKSIDAGATWTQKFSNQFDDLEFHPTNPSIVYATGPYTAIRSTNGGETWQSMPGIPSGYGETCIGVSPAMPSWVYVYKDGYSSPLFKSVDAGVSFTNLPTTQSVSSQSGYCLAFGVSPWNAQQLFIGGVSSYMSSDGGVSWGSLYLNHVDQHAFEFYNGYLYAGNDGGVVRKNLSTGTLENLSNGLNITQIYRMGIDAKNAGRIIIGTQDNGTALVTGKYGDYVYGGDGMECFIDYDNPGYIYYSTQYGYLYRRDEFNRTRNVNPPGTHGTGRWTTPFTMHPHRTDVLYAGFRDLWKSTLRGDEWVNLSANSVVSSGWISRIAVAPSDDNYIYLITTEFARTTNGGKSWVLLPRPHGGNAFINNMAVHPENPLVLWSVVGGFTTGAKVFKSVDGGNTWTNISGSLPNVPFSAVVYQNGSKNGVYVGSDIGVFYKDDTMSDWVSFDAGMPYAIVRDLEINYTEGKLYAGTYGRGAWVSDLYPGSVVNPVHTSIVTPRPNELISSSASVEIWARATSMSGTIAKMEFYDGSTKLSEDTTPPYLYGWQSPSAGEHRIIAKAISTTGASDTASVKIRVINGTVCSASGKITEDLWTNVAGNRVSDIPVSSAPTSTTERTSFEAPQNVADNFARRMRGYICVPATGDYHFFISSDDHSELWLSTNESPANKVKIAYVTGYTEYRIWNKYASQKSAAIRLEQGKQYYIEALHKEGSSKDHLSVGWQWPDGSTELPISGSYLSPYTGPINSSPIVSITNPSNGQTFNAPATVAINATATDSDGTITKVEFYNGSTKLGEDLSSPYSYSWSSVPAGNYSLTARAFDNAGASTNSAAISISVQSGQACAGTGKIQREVWTGIPGYGISLIPTNTAPNSVTDLTIFEEPTNSGDSYGSRIRGYICVPSNGAYTFWIASDDNSELWLSTDENPANKVKIAYVTGYTASRQWDKYPSQRSAAITLVGGKKYYIESMHKEASAGDNLAVGWQLPNATYERPIPGARLIPYSPPVNNLPVVQITSPQNNQIFTAPASISIAANASDSDGSVTKVEFFNGSTKLGEDLTSPYSFTWNNVSAGNYTLHAKATDNQNASTSVSVNIVVQNSSCVVQGFIEREIWTGITGVEISSIPVNTTPTYKTTHSSFETPQYVNNSYGSRMRGYICPPATGAYTFWIASDDNSELWLSTNNQPTNKRKIASVTGATLLKAWDRYPSQKSLPINLVAGTQYYIEALHKEGSGNDHVAVGWQLPNGTFERPIPGTRLSPFETTAAVAYGSSIETFEVQAGQDDGELSVYPNPFKHGALTLVLPDDFAPATRDVKVEIVDVHGQLIFTINSKLEENSNTVSFDIAKPLANGFYMVNAVIERRRYLRKFIVGD
jgi:photosystem II stability/assembly factor-like uncharacterized protein